MAKKKENASGKLRDQARAQLAELGYEKLIENFQLFDPFGDGSMDATADLVAMDGDEPVILFAAAEPGDAARPSIQDDAKFKAGLGADEGKPFRFVWVWDGDNNFVFDLEKDAQISDLPRRELWREIAKPIPVPACFRIFPLNITVGTSGQSSANSTSCMMPSTLGVV